MTDNIPANARRITYDYGHGISGTFHLWESHGRWQWSALGNCGEESTQLEAYYAARHWIRDNQSTKETEDGSS